MVRFGAQVVMMWELWLDQIDSSVLAVFVCAGFISLLWKLRWLGLWFLALGISITLLFVFVQNPTLDREWRWVMSVFSIPLYLISAIALGSCFEWLGQGRFTWDERGITYVEDPSRIGAMLVVVIISALCCISFFSEPPSKRNYFWVADYGRNILNTLAPNAIYFAEPDHAAFSTLYFQVVEGLRPDVTLGRKYGYVNMDLTPELVPVYGEFPRRRHDPAIIGHVLEHTDRPVYVQTPMKLPVEGVRFAAAGLIYRVLRPGEPMARRDWWGEYHWHTLDWRDTRGDFTAEMIWLEVEFAQARQLMEAGRKREGYSELVDAVALYGEDYKILNNAGVLCARFGLREEARAFFEQARALDWREGTAQRNLERLGGAGR